MHFKPALTAFLRLCCPHCSETAMFAPVRSLRSLAGWFDTRPGCPRCEYLFEREPGYFLLATWGTVYLPAVLLGVALMFLLPRWFRLGDAGLLAATLLPTMLLAFAFARHGRALFLIIDHLVDPINEDDRKNYRKRMANEN
jgi:hypothetical protein